MCFGGGGDGGAGETQARIEELERQRQERIRQGVEVINSSFANFNDDYFSDFRNSFLGFYQPQLADQFVDSRGKLIAALRGKGNLQSTSGIRALGDLSEKNAIEQTLLQNRAVDESNKLRGGLETEKANLYALNEASADPERIAPLALGSASAFAAPTAFNPLEGVFASTLNSIAAYNNARNNSPQGTTASPSRFGVASGYGSGSVVR